MKKILLILLLFSFTFAAQAEEILNEESYSSDIWLSKENFFNGEKIRIYTKFKNNNDFDIEQTIEFYDNENLLGEKKVEVVAKEELIIWIDAELDSGEHRIISKIKETIKNTLDSKTTIESTDIQNLKEISIDLDTDGDGIGDENDSDDDNDGVLDVEEIEKGSDPKSSLSTPTIETTKEIITETAENTKNVAESLLDVFIQKRKSIENQLKNSLEEKTENKIKEEEKDKIDIDSYEIQNEINLIKKESSSINFKKQKEEKSKIFLKNTQISQVLETAKKEIIKLDKEKMTKDERDFSKACLYQAKYEKIEELYKEQNSISYWDNFIYYILIILTFIFTNNFLTILFLIFIFWILWKLIKRF